MIDTQVQRTPIPSMAIVHEWVAARAGSEKTFETLAKAFPKADLYALSYAPGTELATDGRAIQTTWLNHRFLRDRRSVTLPLMPLAWRSLGSGRYDVVISSHHAFAHTNLLARPSGIHLSYVHSPARYIWTPDLDRRGSGSLLGPARGILRSLDRRASRHIADYAANSSAVAERIRLFWGREARIIPPPVNVEYFRQTSNVDREDYLLAVGRWVPYKNFPIAIAVADRVGLPIKVAGSGPDRVRIAAAAAAASIPVDLIEDPSDASLRELYQKAAALIFPTHEDFGLVPVEAQAAGTPVVALAQGGALDTVIDGVSGVLSKSLSIVDLAEAVCAARNLRAEDCVKSAERFSATAFMQRIGDWVSSCMH